MKEKNLIASVALFGELYNSETYTSIPDILAEFIRGAVIYENKYSFSSTELKDLLQKVYGFDIPESVVRTTLQNKLKSEITRDNNYYHFNTNIQSGVHKINSELSVIEQTQNHIINNLYLYINAKNAIALSDSDKKEVFENFVHFLMDNGYSDKYSNLISAFVISNEEDIIFKNNLNLIREGIILYQGINFTSDINQIGKWSNDLTIYLSTEHLFNALGYNGILFQEIFNDFYKLVTEINNSSSVSKQKHNPRKKIELRYFEETKDEINFFFNSAEAIKKGYKQLDPSKLAMENILKGCETPSDIKAKRIKFDLELTQRGIKFQEFEFDYNKIKEFNVEDDSIISDLKNKSIEKNRTFNENECRQYFRIFTKINTFRKGESNKSFEKIGHLFVTEKGFAKYLAHNHIVKFGEFDMSFAKDIDFVTTRFWFALKKGFSDKQTLPKSFDVVNKARIILSSHINSSLFVSYEKLIQETKDGKLSNEEALERSHLYREKPNTPEDITIENVDNTLSFLNNEEYIEDFYREKARKETQFIETQKVNQELQAELRLIKEKQYLKEEQERVSVIQKDKVKYALQKWDNTKNQNNKDLFFIIVIFSITLILVTSALLISISKPIKDWLCLFELKQISLIIGYVVLLVIDVMGSRYLFNKEKLKNGWNWVLCFFNYKTYKNQMITTYEKEFMNPNK